MGTSAVIHLIDDDDGVRQSLVFALTATGLAVRAYASASVFLEALPGMQPGCVVSDIRMLGIDGLTLQRRLKELQITLPVIIMTGHGDVRLAVEAMKAGVTAGHAAVIFAVLPSHSHRTPNVQPTRPQVSDQGVVITILAVLALILALRAVLWRLTRLSDQVFPRLLLRAATWPVWARAARTQSLFQAGLPRSYAVLNARFRTDSFTGLPLTLMGLAALYAVVLLGGLVDDLLETEGLVRLDEGVNAVFIPYRTPWLVAAFIWITALGAGPAITGMVATASALLWSQGRARMLLPLWITFLGAQGMTWAGKYVIGRTRPVFLDIVTATSPSFPSGHATASTALIGFLAYVTARDLPRSCQRFEVVFWAAAVIGLICFSRIFLSLHYVTDIAAGLLVGAFWLLAGFTAAELDRVARK